MTKPSQADLGGNETHQQKINQTPNLREKLGKRVREVWILWAEEQLNPKPSWLVPWADLPEQDKEVDRRIGAAIWGDCVNEHSQMIAEKTIERIETATAERSKLADEVSALGRLRLLQERTGDRLTIGPGVISGGWVVYKWSTQVVTAEDTPLKAVEAAERVLMANGTNTEVDEGLEDWKGKHSKMNERTFEPSTKPVWLTISEISSKIPDEEFDKLPRDGASRLDHYIYGNEITKWKFEHPKGDISE